MVLLLILFAVYEINKNIKLKKKFETVLNSLNPESDTTKEESNSAMEKSIGISEQIIQDVL